MTPENPSPAASVSAPPTLPEGARYLGIWPRLIACALDNVLVLALIIPLLMLIKGPGEFTFTTVVKPYLEQFEFMQKIMNSEGDLNVLNEMPTLPPPPSPLEMVIKLILPTTAFLIFWKYRSSTPGKMIFRARIVDATTFGPPTNNQLMMRYVGYFIATGCCFLGFAWILFNPKHQGWHDLMANTVVITP